MIFVQIVSLLTFIGVLAGFSFLFWRWRNPRKLQDATVVVVKDIFVKMLIRDIAYLEATYSLDMPLKERSPIVIYRRYYDGEEHIQLAAQGSYPQIKHYGSYAVALLGEALNDIKKKGALADKKA